MAEAVIQAEQLCCQSGHHYLLKDVCWKVGAGEHWVVFGLNGSGKTTLLSIIAGFKQYTDGFLQVLGQTYTNENVLSLSKQIGWVSASYFDKYYTNETVLQIVLSGLFGTLGIGTEVEDEHVYKAQVLLQQWHVGHKRDMPFSMLSKGEQQNVLIARALMTEPQILVLDEPGTGLDVLAREEMLHHVKYLAETTKVTIIYVTHYPEEIQSCFDHCLLLQHGKVLAQGTIQDIFQDGVLSDLLQIPVHVETRTDGTITLGKVRKGGNHL